MSLSKILVLDVETGGFEPTQPLIEFGAILYDVVSRSIDKIFSCLIPSETNEAEHVNNISLLSLSRATYTDLDESMILSLANQADVYCAQNYEFDKGFIERRWPEWPSKPWIDSMELDYERAAKHKHLSALCLAHGLTVDGSQLHRAMADCKMITQLFNATTDLDGMIAKAMRPKAVFMSMARAFDDNDLVKANGFTWHPAPVKQWRRTMAIEDSTKLPFPVRQVG